MHVVPVMHLANSVFAVTSYETGEVSNKVASRLLRPRERHVLFHYHTNLQMNIKELLHISYLKKTLSPETQEMFCFQKYIFYLKK